MADGSVAIKVHLDDSEASKQVVALQHKIEKLQDSLNDNQSKHNAISDQMEQAQADIEETRRHLQDALDDYHNYQAGGGGDITDITRRMDDAASTLEKQEAEYNKLEEKDKAILDKIEQQNKELEYQQRLLGMQQKTDIEKGQAAKEKEAQAQSTKLKGTIKGIAKSIIGIASLAGAFKYIKSAVSDASGTLAKYDSETKKNVNDLKNSLNAMRGAIGTAFAPIVNVVVPYLVQLINWLTKAGNALGNFLAILAGKSSYYKAVAKNLDNVSKSAGSATKSLLGIDELNKLDSGGSGSSDSYGLEKTETEMPEWLESLDLTKITSAVEKLKESFTGLMDEIGKVFSWLYDNVLMPIVSWAIESALPAVFNLIATALDTLTIVIQNLEPYGKWLVENLLAPIASFVGDLFVKFLEDVTEWLGKINDLLSGETTFSDFINSLDGKDIILTSIATAIGLVVAAIGAWNIVQAVLNGVLGVFSGILTFLAANPVVLLVAALAAIVAGIILVMKHFEEILDFLDDLTDRFNTFVEFIENGISDLSNTIVSWLTDNLGIVGEMLSAGIATFTTIIQTIVGVVSTVFNAVLAVIKTIVAAIGAIASGDWKTACNSIKEAWSSVWEGIKSTTRGIINTLLANVETMVNGVITGINKILSGASSALSFLTGGSISLQLNYVTLPRLAKGGIVDAATPFIAGEAGKEAVIPLENNMEWVTVVADGILDRLMDSSKLSQLASAFVNLPEMATGSVVPPRVTIESDGGIADLINELRSFRDSMSDSGGEIINKLYLDGKQIADSVTKYQRQTARAMGG